jgi:hypothetical protein
MITEFLEEIGTKNVTQAKLDWLRENINENSNQELVKLLDNGMSLFDPGFSNYVRNIISSNLTRKALEIPINRVTTQEIPDPEGLLKSRRPTKDGKLFYFLI